MPYTVSAAERRARPPGAGDAAAHALAGHKHPNCWVRGGSRDPAAPCPAVLSLFHCKQIVIINSSMGCSSPSAGGRTCTVSSSALPLGTQWLCFMVNKHCTRDSWLQWRDGELMLFWRMCPVPSPCPWGAVCDPTARHFSFWGTASFPQITFEMRQYHFSFPVLASSASWQLQPLMSILCSTTEVASEAVTGSSCSSVPPPLHLPAEL